MKTVSIIIPVYGVEKYLVRCVDSVLTQTYDSLQIVLVDDGSPDECPAICDEYAQKDKRVKVVHKKNGGLSSARNAGLEVATGEYICFFDSDDYVESDMIEKLVLSIEENNDEVCVCGYFADFYDEQEKQLFTKVVSPDFSYLQANFSLDKYERVLGLCGYAWNKLYRLSFLKNKGFQFEEGVSLVEDLLFNRQVFCSGAKIRFLQYSAYHYIQRKRETLGAKYYANYFELKEKAVEAKCDLLRAWGVEKNLIVQFYNNNYIDLVWGTIKNIQASMLPKKDKIKRVSSFIKGRDIKEALKGKTVQDKKRKMKRLFLTKTPLKLLLKILK